MERKVKSFRLRTDLLSWVESYARERESSQIAVVEQALESMRADAEGGVPDLPEAVEYKPAKSTPSPETVVRIQKTVEERERELRERHRKFAREMGWA